MPPKTSVTICVVVVIAIMMLYMLPDDTDHMTVLAHGRRKEAAPGSDCARFGLRALPTTRSSSALRPRIYDLIALWSEDDMLHIRMHELSTVVDYFVIVECDLTYSGVERSLFWPTLRNQTRFQPYLHQVVFHSVKAREDLGTHERQQNALDSNIRMLLAEEPAEVRPRAGDVMLFTDCDEIPRADFLRQIKTCDQYSWESPAAMNMIMFNFNYRTSLGLVWNESKIFRVSPEMIREKLVSVQRFAKPRHLFVNAGWHCSYCFAHVSQFIRKIEAMAHAEYNVAHFKQRDRILQRIRNAKDLFDYGVNFTLMQGPTEELDAPRCVRYPRQCGSTALYMSDVEEFTAKIY